MFVELTIELLMRWPSRPGLRVITVLHGKILVIANSDVSWLCFFFFLMKGNKLSRKMKKNEIHN
jgi:hypothetical protein